MMRLSYRKILCCYIVVVLLSIVAGCGFQLRSSSQLQQISAEYPNLTLRGIIPNDELYQQLQTAWRKAGGSISSAAALTLDLADVEWQNVQLQLSPSGEGLYQLNLTLQFRYLLTDALTQPPLRRYRISSNYSLAVANPVLLASQQQIEQRALAQRAAEDLLLMLEQVEMQ